MPPQQRVRSGGELFIVDNADDDWKVHRYLHDWCEIARAFDIATGYFEIGSLLSLDGQWQKLDKVRILMGDEVSKQTKRAFEEGLANITRRLDHSIEKAKDDDDFLSGVPAIVEAIQSGKILARVYREEKFHAKAYITHAKLDVVGAAALVGSSNFTYPGLHQNVELNIQVRREVEELQEWYERYWDEAQTCLAQNNVMARRNAKREYLLRGMVFCPCGRRRVGRYKNHLDRAYYRCSATESERWRSKCEDRYSHRQEILEEAVWEKVQELILEPENLIREIELRRAEAHQEGERKTTRLDEIESATAEVDRQMGILLDQVLTAGFSQSILDQKKQQLLQRRTNLQAEAERIQEELKEMTITPDQEAQLMHFAQQMRETLDDLTCEMKRHILELVRLRVDVIHRTRVKISGVISSEGLFVDLLPT